MTLGEKLRQLRQKRNWTVEKLAHKSGTNPIAIYLYEGGHRLPSVDKLRILSDALGISMGAFQQCDPFVAPKRRKKEQASLEGSAASE